MAIAVEITVNHKSDDGGERTILCLGEAEQSIVDVLVEGNGYARLLGFGG